MKSSRSLFLGCVLSLSFVAGANAQEKLRQTSLYPLQVGNTWTYKIVTEKAGTSHFTLKVTKHEKIGNTECARIENLVDGKVRSVQHVSVTEDGIYNVAMHGITLDKPVCILRLPPKKGDTWAINSRGLAESVTGKATTGEVSEVKVPARTYKTVITSTSIDLKANGLDIGFIYYFAEGAGIVKQEVTVAGEKSVWELEKFEAGK